MNSFYHPLFGTYTVSVDEGLEGDKPWGREIFDESQY